MSPAIRSTLTLRPLFRPDDLAGALLLDEVDQGGFVMVLELLGIEASGLLVHYVLAGGRA